MFSVHLECLILCFSDGSEHTPNIVVALPYQICQVMGLDPVMITRISWILLLDTGLVCSSLLKSSLRIFIYYLFSELCSRLHFPYRAYYRNVHCKQMDEYEITSE